MEQNNDSAEADEKVICGMNSYAHDIAIFFSRVRYNRYERHKNMQAG